MKTMMNSTISELDKMPDKLTLHGEREEENINDYTETRMSNRASIGFGKYKKTIGHATLSRKLLLLKKQTYK